MKRGHTRYSVTLTKDVLFVGLRDLVRKIGEFIMANFEVHIVFSVGVLKAKNRQLSFEFDASALASVSH